MLRRRNPRELLDEATLYYMNRTATEARLRASAEWAKDNVRTECRYRPPPGRGLRRQHLRSTRKELAGRFYQFLAAHANIGSYLHRVGRIVSQALRRRREGEDGRKVDREGGGRAGPALRVFLFSCLRTHRRHAARTGGTRARQAPHHL